MISTRALKLLEVTSPPGAQSKPHRHPCGVVGYITVDTTTTTTTSDALVGHALQNSAA